MIIWICGADQDIKEVQNAYQAYEKLLDIDPYQIDSLLIAHQVLMNDLTNESGRFRSGGVGVFAGEQLVHMASPAHLDPKQGTESISTIELMDLVGIRHRPTFRDNYLLPAIECGYVEMTIPDKPRSSKQKYRKVKEK